MPQLQCMRGICIIYSFLCYDDFMESLIHADIFFFITTIIVIVLGILSAIILFYITTILADIREISRIARSESVDIAEDIKHIRKEVNDELQSGSSIIFSLIKVIRNLFRHRRTTNRSNTKKNNEKSNSKESRQP